MLPDLLKIVNDSKSDASRTSNDYGISYEENRESRDK
jgi:hypothetical protein